MTGGARPARVAGDVAVPAPPCSRRAVLLGGLVLVLAPHRGRVAAAAGGAPPAATPPRGGVQVTLVPPGPHPGDVVLVRVAGAPPAARLEWDGRPLALFAAEGGAAALAGVDLDRPPGPVAWRILGPAGPVTAPLATGTVRLRARTFPVQRLTLPPAMVDLDPATLARVDAERAALQAALADSAPERLWRGRFRPPVEGAHPTGGFGLRRLINGQPRSPHTGYDWAAPVGTPVAAANAGRVALVAEHFFAGRNVVLDHGLGLFTLYFHLDEIRVAASEAVAAGQVIGTVGATGRVTGPHLHFGVLLGGARVDPETLLALPLPAEAAS